MVVVTKALVRTSDGYVENIVVYDSDGTWEVPDGCELVDIGPSAQLGATWDGNKFLAPVLPVVSRLDILMAEGPKTQVYDSEAEALVDRPAEDIAADKTELLGLLQTKLAASEDLTWEEMNKMLALERES
jgi:hypothetical protein